MRYAIMMVLLSACVPSDRPVSYGEAQAESLAEAFPVAGYYADCAPWDGPALTLVFAAAGADPAAPGVPHLRISTYRPPSVLPGSSFDWRGTDHNYGHAELCRSEGACEVPHAVEVEFDALLNDGSLRGELSVGLIDGRVISGAFEAEVVQTTFLCG